jgi:hypothetical protein
MISEVLISSTSIGYGVSMALSGKSLLGAGTSIYKDISYFTPTCPKYLTSDSMFDSHYLMSYYDSAQDASTIVLMELSNPRDTTVLASSTFPSEVYDIATLNQQTGIFVAINQDLDETQDTATVIAGCSIPPSFSDLSLQERSLRQTHSSHTEFQLSMAVNTQSTHPSPVSPMIHSRSSISIQMHRTQPV